MDVGPSFRRRDSGTGFLSSSGCSSESMSKLDKPKCAVLAFAPARKLWGRIQERGKGRKVLNCLRVMEA